MDVVNRLFEQLLPLLEKYDREGVGIDPETDLAADLNIDSVAAMDLIMEIEDRFDVDIPVNLLADVRTVSDLLQLVQTQLRTRSS